MFLGNSFASSTESHTSTLISNSKIDHLSVKNAIFKEILVTSTVLDGFDGVIPNNWDFNTRLHAFFNNSLHGGNVGFTESIVEKIRIKRRIPNFTNFQTMFEKEITCNDDFSIILFDYDEPVGDIEYAYVPIISGGESNYIVNTVHSSFDDYFLIGKDVAYPLKANVSATETLNYNATSVKPIDRKYPVSIINGKTGYKSGQLVGTFIDFHCDNNDYSQVRNYREKVYSFLTDYRPKLLKGFDGELYMISIDGNIEDSKRDAVLGGNQKFNLVTTKFNWFECGDAYDIKHLYNNGFIDVVQL